LWFHTTSPAFSSSILSALLQRLTTLGFIVVSPAVHPLFRVGDPPGFPRCLSALRSFPSADSCRRRMAFPFDRACFSVRGGSRLLPDRHPALLHLSVVRCRRRSLPRPPPLFRHSVALKPALAVILHVAVPDPCLSVRSVHTLREFTSRLTATPFLSSPSMPRGTSGCQHLAMPALDREPRGIPPSSGPLPGRRFQRTVPGAPVGLGSSVSLREPHR